MLVLLTILAACSDVEDVHDHDHDHNHGVIDEVELTFTPASGEAPLTFSYIDGEGAEPITLLSGQDYALSVAFFASDGDDMTKEIIDDAEAHQIFFLGEGINSAATTNTDGVVSIDYADADANGLPIGLDNDVVATLPGSASLQVVLRHLPPESDEAVKVAGLAEEVASGGLSSIGGDSDTDVTFDVTVSE